MKAAALSLALVAGAAGDYSTTKQQMVVSKENALHELLAERRINKDTVHHNASDEFNQFNHALAGKSEVSMRTPAPSGARPQRRDVGALVIRTAVPAQRSLDVGLLTLCPDPAAVVVRIYACADLLQSARADSLVPCCSVHLCDSRAALSAHWVDSLVSFLNRLNFSRAVLNRMKLYCLITAGSSRILLD